MNIWYSLAHKQYWICNYMISFRVTHANLHVTIGSKISCQKCNSIYLDASLTPFIINGMLKALAHEILIESRINNVSYERFFNSCSPIYCTCKYHYRFDSTEFLTRLLSVHGGLSLAIRIAVSFLFKIINKIRKRCRVARLK